MNFENHLTTRKQFRERITYQGVDLVVSKTFETFEWRFLHWAESLGPAPQRLFALWIFNRDLKQKLLLYFHLGWLDFKILKDYSRHFFSKQSAFLSYPRLLSRRVTWLPVLLLEGQSSSGITSTV